MHTIKLHTLVTNTSIKMIVMLANIIIPNMAY